MADCSMGSINLHQSAGCAEAVQESPQNLSAAKAILSDPFFPPTLKRKKKRQPIYFKVDVCYIPFYATGVLLFFG